MKKEIKENINPAELDQNSKTPFWQRSKFVLYFAATLALFVIMLSLFLVILNKLNQEEGRLELKKNGSDPSIEQSIEQVIVTTDKLEYEIGETIKINFKNENDFPVHIESWRLCNMPSAQQLEEGETKENIIGMENWICETRGNLGYGFSLDPRESKTFSSYRINQNPQEDTVYRMGISFRRPSPAIGWKLEEIISYSNEFVIKSLDKPVVIASVPFAEYANERISLMESYESITDKTSVVLDLNGDGRKEEVSVDKVKYPDGGGSISTRINISGLEERVDNVATEFIVVDLDNSDSYQEVVLIQHGHAGQGYRSMFFRYNGQDIKKIGDFYGEVTVLGDGELLESTRQGFWWKTNAYILNPETHELELVPKETYRINYETEAISTFPLYKEKRHNSEVVGEIKQGDAVIIILAENCDVKCDWFLLESGGIRGWVNHESLWPNLDLPTAG